MRCKPITLNEDIKEHQTPAPKVTKAYLLGLLHDSTETKYTYRICQKSLSFIQFVSQGIVNLGFKSWVYKEGKDRHIHVVEFSKKLLKDFTLTTMEEEIDYIRGYFDSEGSVPRNLEVRYYIYFAQKNLEDITHLRSLVTKHGLKCGNIHVPSREKDPDYYRFYILCNSWERFGSLVGSYHPDKQRYIRMKI